MKTIYKTEVLRPILKEIYNTIKKEYDDFEATPTDSYEEFLKFQRNCVFPIGTHPKEVLPLIQRLGKSEYVELSEKETDFVARLQWQLNYSSNEMPWEGL